MSALVRLARLGARRVELRQSTPKTITIAQRFAQDWDKRFRDERKKVMQEYHKAEVSKPWVSYGFDNESEVLDRHVTHCAFFMAITVCLITGGVLMAYAPDTDLKNWAQREAFLQLRYREEHGLPLIDPNFIDPAKMILPSDEELGDARIII